MDYGASNMKRTKSMLSIKKSTHRAKVSQKTQGESFFLLFFEQFFIFITRKYRITRHYREYKKKKWRQEKKKEGEFKCTSKAISPRPTFNQSAIKN
jgi:hypothetical protein